MAAEWYYVSNQQQTGPVELAALQQMLRAGALSGRDLVFGPGLSEWTAVAQIPSLGSTAGGPGQALPYSADGGQPGAMLGYRGMDTGGSGLSDRAIDMLRQTKPWVRLMSVICFVFAGLMVLSGLIIAMASAAIGTRSGLGLPAMVGVLYVALGAFYLVPGIMLHRYAGRIGRLMLSNRMNDLEEALGAQKSFWKFVGIMVLVMIGLYVVGIAIVVIMKM